MTPHTVFPVGSCTKAFTSTLAAKLAAGGKLDLDGPVRRWLPDYRHPDPALSDRVTLGDLLSHRTGVRGYDLLWYDAPWPLAESVRRLSLLPKEGPFRSSYHYSSLQFLAAGMCLERAAGKPYADLLRAELLAPLGMAGATVTGAEFHAAPDRASGHQVLDSGAVGAMREYDFAEANPAGSVAASVSDLVPWVRLHLNRGHHAGRQLVPAAELARTHAAQIKMPLSDPDIASAYPRSTRVDYCLGWARADYAGEAVLLHGGVVDGFRAQITLVPRLGVGIVLLNNLHKTRLNGALTNKLLDVILKLPPRDWDAEYRALDEADRAAQAAKAKLAEPPVLPTAPGLELAAFAGTYADDAYGEVGVSVGASGRLVWKWSRFEAELVCVGPGAFRIASGLLVGEPVEFAAVSGEVKRMACLTRVFTRRRA